ncbi:MAG TPA: hypothetical protein VGM10_26785 [Actinocrinis sp.]|jgi:hypothetical protein
MAHSSQGVADQLTAALETGDAHLMEPLSDPAVRWGGEEETEETCHSRGDVLTWYRRLYDSGVRVEVTGVVVRDGSVVLSMAITGSKAGPSGRLPDLVHQVFHLEAGLGIDIRGYAQREDALAWADTPIVRN